MLLTCTPKTQMYLSLIYFNWNTLETSKGSGFPFATTAKVRADVVRRQQYPDLFVWRFRMVVNADTM
jgi:hypothetical protein